MTNVLQTDYASPPARAGPRGRRRRQQGRTRQIREIREPLFFLLLLLMQRSVSARLPTAWAIKCSVTARSPRLPSPVPHTHTCNHRTARGPHFVLTLFARRNLPWPSCALMAPSLVPPGARGHRDALRGLSWLLPFSVATTEGPNFFSRHSTARTCAVTTAVLEGPNLPRQSSPPPSRPNYVRTYLPAYRNQVHAPVSCIASRPQLPSTYRQDIGDLWAQFPTHCPYHRVPRPTSS